MSWSPVGPGSGVENQDTRLPAVYTKAYDVLWWLILRIVLSAYRLGFFGLRRSIPIYPLPTQNATTTQIPPICIFSTVWVVLGR